MTPLGSWCLFGEGGEGRWGWDWTRFGRSKRLWASLFSAGLLCSELGGEGRGSMAALVTMSGRTSCSIPVLSAWVWVRPLGSECRWVVVCSNVVVQASRALAQRSHASPRDSSR